MSSTHESVGESDVWCNCDSGLRNTTNQISRRLPVTEHKDYDSGSGRFSDQFADSASDANSDIGSLDDVEQESAAESGIHVFKPDSRLRILKVH